MHYRHFSSNKNKSIPTITTKIPEFYNIIGQYLDFSKMDTLRLTRMYNCCMYMLSHWASMSLLFNLTAIGLCKTHSYVHTPPLILIQPGHSSCWISVPLIMQAFVGWSRPLMMWSVSTLRALQAHWITHSWGNAEVWIMSLHVYCNFRGNETLL